MCVYQPVPIGSASKPKGSRIIFQLKKGVTLVYKKIWDMDDQASTQYRKKECFAHIAK